MNSFSTHALVAGIALAVTGCTTTQYAGVGGDDWAPLPELFEGEVQPSNRPLSDELPKFSPEPPTVAQETPAPPSEPEVATEPEVAEPEVVPEPPADPEVIVAAPAEPKAEPSAELLELLNTPVAR